MKRIASFEEFINENLNESFSRPTLVAAVNNNTDFHAATGEPMFNDVEIEVFAKPVKRGLNYKVKPDDKFVILHSTHGNDGESSHNVFPEDFKIFGSSAATIDDARLEALKSLETTADDLEDMVEILDLSTGKKYTFEDEVAITPVTSPIEQEAKEFFNSLAYLFEEPTPMAIKKLASELNKLPEDKKRLYKDTDVYNDYMNSFVDAHPSLERK
jgi:hypothetical protein